MNQDDQELIDECTTVLKKHFSIVSNADSYTDMDPFLMYNTHKNVQVYDSFLCAEDNLEISIVEYFTISRTSVASSLYLFGLFTLQKEYPLTYLFRETLRERVANLFVKADLDFKENKKFSRKFHLVTKDREKLKILWVSKDLDMLADFPDMEMEINGQQCLFRASMLSICEEEAIKFTNLAKTLMKILY